MVDSNGDQAVPQRMLDLLRMFLAASSRGEHTVLVLESRKSTITTKYRCVENLAGTPASPSTSRTDPKKKMNPARARRSRLRLEEFIKKKNATETSLEAETEPVKGSKVDEAAGGTNQLIIKLPLEENRHVDIGAVPQLDGHQESDQKVMFSFRSEYGEEDIDYSLSKVLPEKAVPNLVSRVRVGPRSADHVCILEVKGVDGRTFVWPRMNTSDAEVLREPEKM